MSIIKSIKTTQYMQIHNHPVQEDLDDLEAIGLLTYIMSLPEDWILRKTFLHKKFSRRKVDNSWKQLVEKGYVIGFQCRVDGKREYIHGVSDIPLTEDDFYLFTEKEVKTLKEKGSSVFHIEPIKDLPFENTDISVLSSGVQNVQHKMSSTECAVQDVQLQKNYEQNKDEQINTNKLNKSKSEEVEDSYLPNMIKTRTQKNIERIEKDDVNILLIEKAWEKWNNQISEAEFALTVGNVLTNTKEPIRNVFSLLDKSIKNYTNPKESYPHVDKESHPPLKPKYYRTESGVYKGHGDHDIIPKWML